MQAFYHMLNGDGILKETRNVLRTGLIAGTVLLMLTVSLAAFANPASAALTSVWTDATPMGGARTFPAVVQNDEGLVYVMGGVVNGTSWDSTPLANSYDSASGAWTTLAPMPKGLRWHSGALGHDGKVYVMAGHNDSDGTLYAPVQTYDPASDSWSTGAAIPTRVCFAPAVTLDDGRIYVIGGRNTGSVAVDLMQVYDPVADSWSTSDALPSARYGGTAVVWGDYILYAGGYVGGVPSTEVLIHYPWGGWGTVSSMPEALIFAASIVGEDGGWYVMGGGNEGLPSDDSYMYDMYTNSWTELPVMGLGVTYVSAAASAPDGRVLVLGGTNYSLSIRASDRVQSLQVMTKSITLSADSVGQGGSVLVTVSCDYAFKTAVRYSLDSYVLAGGVVYSPVDMGIPVPGAFAFVVDVPQQIPAGSHEVVLDNLVVWFESGSWEYDPIELPITVERSIRR
jgi:N-acetylneuraminic acid mutarotase